MRTTLAACTLLVAVADASPRDRAPPAVQEDSSCHGPVIRVTTATAEALARVVESAASVWKVSGREATINVPPGGTAEVSALPGVIGVTVQIDDLAALVEQQDAARKRNWTMAHSLASRCRDENGLIIDERVCGALRDPFFDEYREIEMIHLYMEALALEHPELARLEPNIGYSYEGRPVPALLIGGEDAENAVYLQAEIHAREWITPTIAMWIAVELLESDDPALRELVQSLTFIIIPVSNPDGYVHTWTPGGRQWRKSRSPNAGSPCLGTDLNRNWDAGDWGGPGASTDPCAGTYRGAGPFSEVEVANVRDYLAQYTSKRQKGTTEAQNLQPAYLRGGIDYHSFGQIFLRPYAWASTATNPPPNDAEVAIIGQAMAEACESTPEGVPYTSGGWYDDLYPSSGVCADWLFNVTSNEHTGLGIAFTAELRDLGQFGFVLPDSEIRPVGIEQLAALKEFARAVLLRASNTTDR